MFIFLVFGAIIGIIGGIVVLSNLGNRRRRKRIVDMPTLPIAQAPGNAPVEIKGRILPSEQGILVAPFSGRHAVWVRVTIQEYRSNGKSGYWYDILKETDARSFMVEDGSGQLARVHPGGANVILEQQLVASSGTFNDAPPHLEGFLQSRGKSSKGWVFNKQMRYQEEVLVHGDNLYALGPSRREAGPPTPDGYRTAATSQLVLFAAQGEVGELILTNKTEEQLLSKLGNGFVIGLVMLGIGAFFAFVGIVGTVVQVML